VDSEIQAIVQERKRRAMISQETWVKSNGLMVLIVSWPLMFVAVAMAGDVVLQDNSFARCPLG